jgi:hypothetical protein
MVGASMQVRVQAPGPKHCSLAWVLEQLAMHVSSTQRMHIVLNQTVPTCLVQTPAHLPPAWMPLSGITVLLTLALTILSPAAPVRAQLAMCGLHV